MDIVIAIIVLGVLVFVHELGHFLVVMCMWKNFLLVLDLCF